MKIALLLTLSFLSVLPVRAATTEDSNVSSNVQVDGIASKVADELWSQTDVYWHIGDHQRIIALDRIIVEAAPDFVQSYSIGGWLMESDGNNNDAEAFYQKDVEFNPTHAFSFYDLGVFYFKTLHDYAAAAYMFSEGTKRDDVNINDWKMLGHSYEKLNNLPMALSTWEIIRKRWPDGPAVELNYRRIIAKAAMQKPSHTEPNKLP